MNDITIQVGYWGDQLLPPLVIPSSVIAFLAFAVYFCVFIYCARYTLRWMQTDRELYGMPCFIEPDLFDYMLALFGGFLLATASPLVLLALLVLPVLNWVLSRVIFRGIP